MGNYLHFILNTCCCNIKQQQQQYWDLFPHDIHIQISSGGSNSMPANRHLLGVYRKYSNSQPASRPTKQLSRQLNIPSHTGFCQAGFFSFIFNFGFSCHSYIYNLQFCIFVSLCISFLACNQ